MDTACDNIRNFQIVSHEYMATDYSMAIVARRIVCSTFVVASMNECSNNMCCADGLNLDNPSFTKFGAMQVIWRCLFGTSFAYVKVTFAPLLRRRSPYQRNNNNIQAVKLAQTLSHKSDEPRNGVCERSIRKR